MPSTKKKSTAPRDRGVKIPLPLDKAVAGLLAVDPKAITKTSKTKKKKRKLAKQPA